MFKIDSEVQAQWYIKTEKTNCQILCKNHGLMEYLE